MSSGTHATVGSNQESEERAPHVLSEQQWRDYVVRKLAEGASRMDTMQTEIHLTRQASERVLDSTKHVVAAFDAAAGAFKVLEWLGKVAKPLLFISGLGTAIAIGVLEVRRRLGI